MMTFAGRMSLTRADTLPIGHGLDIDLVSVKDTHFSFVITHLASMDFSGCFSRSSWTGVTPREVSSLISACLLFSLEVKKS